MCRSSGAMAADAMRCKKKPQGIGDDQMNRNDLTVHDEA